MARTKLIAKYSALNTPDLPRRIYDKLLLYINDNGIEHLPEVELSGRWTGKIDISNGGWRNDFDLLCPVLALCRVDRKGVVSPDMTKIMIEVASWIDYLTTPDDENDDYIGASDETFDDNAYLDDDTNDYQSAAYAAEIDAFLNSDNPDLLAHDKALTDIDNLCFGITDDNRESDESDRIFKEGYSITRIDSEEDFYRMVEAMEREAAEGNGDVWASPDFDKEKMAKMFEAEEEDPAPTWMEFIDNLRNGRYGELPEDYDGLAEPDDEEDEDNDPEQSGEATHLPF